MQGERLYTAKSGNTCRCRIEEKDANIGISALWKRQPSEEDKRELMQFIHDGLEAEGIRTGDMVHSEQGPGVAGTARSVEAVRRFLATGDSGVPIEKFEPDAKKDDK